MKTTIIRFLSILFIVNLSAQTKEFSQKLEGEKTLLNSVIADKGSIILVTGKNKKSSKKQEKRILKLDKDLNVVYDKDLIDGEKSINMSFPGLFAYNNYLYASDNGNYLLLNTTLNGASNGSWIIDKQGVMHYYEYEDNNIKKVFTYFTDEKAIAIGTQRGRKNYKRKYSNDDLYIESVNNNDFQVKLKQIKFSENIKKNTKEDDEEIEWYKGHYNNNEFDLLAVDKVNDDRNEVSYHIQTNDFDGELINYKNLVLKLDNNHFLMSRSNAGPSFYYDSSFGNSAIGNVSVDKISQHTYISGFYTEKLKKGMFSGVYKGFYIYKYNPDGELVWKKMYPLNEYKTFNKKNKAYKVSGELSIIDEDKAIFVMTNNAYLDEQMIYSIDLVSGEVTGKYNSSFKIKTVVKGSGISRVVIFSYKNKKLYPKKTFTFEAVTALTINEEIKNYIKRLDPNEKMHIDAKIMENGSIILSHYNYKSKLFKATKLIKFLKFN